MSVQIPMSGNYLTTEQFNWICQNIGRQFYYLHNKRGGRGWTLNKGTLTIDDEHLASIFILKFK